VLRLVLRVEDGFERLVGHALRRLGRPVQVRVFPGYGVEGRVRLLGRVVVAGPSALDPRVDRPSTFQVLGANLSQYLTSELPSARVRIECGDQSQEVSADHEGYVDEVVDVGLPTGSHEVRMTPLQPPGETSTGTVHVHDADVPLAVVSDIDDTVIDSGIARGVLATVRTGLLQSSAARVPLEGAPGLYRALARDPGDGRERPFFYLSTSPWNLAGFLAGFLERHGFPAGPLLLTDWGPGERGLLRVGSREHKGTALRRLAQELPSASFILLGDSGQQDATIYADFARESPGRVRAVYIRQAHGRRDESHQQAVERAGRDLEEAGIPYLLTEDSADMLEHARQVGLANR